jgi:hypothetical protein
MTDSCVKTFLPRDVSLGGLLAVFFYLKFAELYVSNGYDLVAETLTSICAIRLIASLVIGKYDFIKTVYAKTTELLTTWRHR